MEESSSPMANALMGGLPFGVKRRGQLYPGEDNYFRQNPKVTGMAAEDDAVILNPYSSLSEQEKQAVARNEAARVHMRRSETKPSFALTEDQRRQFAGTPYEGNEQAMRETIAARIFSGDPSGGEITPEQNSFLTMLRALAGTTR